MCVITNHIDTEKKIIVGVAGKNDIAVEILKYLSDYYKNVNSKNYMNINTWFFCL